MRELASEFKARIEMRQIGARDEAKVLGGYGTCGRPLCCTTWLQSFEPISIKMAKRQNLSLNPSRLSGACGRLKCCLRYELPNAKGEQHAGCAHESSCERERRRMRERFAAAIVNRVVAVRAGAAPDGPPRGPERPRVGVTMGDPAGIGPEIALAAAADPRVTSVCEPVLYGPLTADERARFRPGELSAAAGRAALDAVERAAADALAGRLDAIATGPINKEALALAGSPWRGHTELLADLTRARDVAMMFHSQRLCVVLATVHVPLSAVPRLLTRDRVETVLDLAAAQPASVRGGPAPPRARRPQPARRRRGDCSGPRTATCWRRRRRRRGGRGIDVAGPLPADTVFRQAVDGRFDAVVACYHDQGLIPVKLAAFGEAVNVTLGLPIVRTSVDHGTAFDIAGRGGRRCRQPRAGGGARGPAGHGPPGVCAAGRRGHPAGRLSQGDQRDMPAADPQRGDKPIARTARRGTTTPSSTPSRRASPCSAPRSRRSARVASTCATATRGSSRARSFLHNVHISPYSHRGYADHEPMRRRKLLCSTSGRSPSSSERPSSAA